MAAAEHEPGNWHDGEVQQVRAAQPVARDQEQPGVERHDRGQPEVGTAGLPRTDDEQGRHEEPHQRAPAGNQRDDHERFSRLAWMAVKIASAVEGAGSGTSPPGSPKDAIASRMASRTENASMSGGSPTALLP